MITRVGVVLPDLADKLNPDSYNESIRNTFFRNTTSGLEKKYLNEFKESKWRIALGDKQGMQQHGMGRAETPK